MDQQRLILKYVGEPKSRTIDFYAAHGGYRGAAKAVKELKPDDLIEEVKKSGLRGRGGAGFSTGTKWSFVPKSTAKPKYVVCNADESEPGTFKDRAIIEHDPHAIIEGIVIACWAIQSHAAYIYIRGEMVRGYRILEAAIREATAKGYVGKGIFGTAYDLDITVHRGAGAYICGEETAQLSSIEGGRGYPKLKPPFPAVEGLFGCPTVINNVETLANLPHILTNGADWFRKIGTEKSTGTRIYGVSGHVNKPGLYEFPMGVSLRELVEVHAGGVRNGKKLKAVIPGGSSVPVLKAEEIDVNLDYESVAAAGSLLGSAGIIVMDETTCMVNALWNVLRFYAHESCGQCTPCREGTGWLAKMVGRIEQGGGNKEDLAMVSELAGNMVGKTICVLADAAAMPAQSYVKKFRAEFEDHVTVKGCHFRQKMRS